jgi:hypothetical protein
VAARGRSRPGETRQSLPPSGGVLHASDEPSSVPLHELSEPSSVPLQESSSLSLESQLSLEAAQPDPAAQASQKLGPLVGGGGGSGGGGGGGGVKTPASNLEQLIASGGQPPSKDAAELTCAIGDEDAATSASVESPPARPDGIAPGAPASPAS